MFPGFTVGTLLGWEHAYMLKNDSNLLSVPFLHIGAMLGAIIASIVMDRKGRHVCLWAFFWFLYLAVIIRLITSNLLVTCIFRVLAGISVGAYYQVVPIYIAELSYRRHRGVILAAIGCLIAIGIIAAPNSYTFTPLLIIDILFGVVFFMMKFWFAPETAYYDFARDHFYDAMYTLHRCHHADQWGSEIREISLEVSAYPRDELNCLSFALHMTDLNVDFLHRTVTILGMLLLSQGLFISCHLGINLYFFADGEKAGVFFIQIVIVLVAFIINLFVIDRYGRKVLLLISSIGVALFYLVIFAMYCDGYAYRDPTITIMRQLLVFFFYLGWDFIPIVYMSELMPYSIRAPSVSFCLFFYFLAKAVFPVTSFYTQLFLHYAIPPLVFFFVAVACGFFGWFIPPETKQMSLCAIQIKMDHDVTVFEDRLEVD